jgi:hypothetical protein
MVHAKMKKITYAIFIILIISGCATSRQEYQAYFPPAVFETRPDLNKFIESWYSKHLRALEEEPLPPKTGNKESEIYRFTCLRTFHKPFSIRIDVIDGGKGVLIRKLTSGQGGYDPGMLEEKQLLSLSRQSIEALRDLTLRIDFLHLPTTKVDQRRMDGAQWIVEVVSNGNYHVVHRSSPDPDTEIREFGEYALILAGWKPDELY